VRRKAAENLLQAKALKLVPDPEDRTPITDPIGKLFEAAEEAEAMKDVLSVVVNDLKEIGYRGGLFYDSEGRVSGVGTEQTRAEFLAYERALDRFVRMLIDIAKLDLDTRRLRIEEWHRVQIAGAAVRVLSGAAAKLGLDVGDGRVRQLVAEELRALPAVIEP
jgi:hypothetical protein